MAFVCSDSVLNCVKGSHICFLDCIANLLQLLGLLHCGNVTSVVEKKLNRRMCSSHPFLTLTLQDKHAVDSDSDVLCMLWPFLSYYLQKTGKYFFLGIYLTAPGTSVFLSALFPSL